MIVAKQFMFAFILAAGLAALGTFAIKQHGFTTADASQAAVESAVITEQKLALFEDFSATRYLLQTGDKAVPVHGDSDCAKGALSCPTTITLKPVATPPGSAASSNLIGDATYHVSTDSGIFTAMVRVRQTGASTGVTLSCVAPNGESRSASTVEQGQYNSWQYFVVICPNYTVDSKHYISAKFQISVAKGNDFATVR